MDPQELLPLEAGLSHHPRPSVARPRNCYSASRSCYIVPLRLCRLLGMLIILPSLFLLIPLYLRYRVFSGQMYPMSMTDMRLIDSKISTTWCQRQVVKSNATFNAFVVPGQPKLTEDLVPVSMTRELELGDDMKEYWGFYLLKGSSVTVSTCVKYPGASLIMIKGYKHLQECAYIGDDSSEEVDELLEAYNQGLINDTTFSEKIQNIAREDGKANDPGTMRRHKAGVSFHDPNHAANETSIDEMTNTLDLVADLDHDPKELREILERLHALREAAKVQHAKTYHPPSNIMALPALHRHRDANVDKDERKWLSFQDIDGNNSDVANKSTYNKENITTVILTKINKEKLNTSELKLNITEEKVNTSKEKVNTSKEKVNTSKEKVNTSKEKVNTSKEKVNTSKVKVNTSEVKVNTSKEKVNTSEVKLNTTEFKLNTKKISEKTTENSSDTKGHALETIGLDTTAVEEKEGTTIENEVFDLKEVSTKYTEASLDEPDSREVFEDVLKRLQALGDKGKRVLIKLHETMGVDYEEKPPHTEKADIMSVLTGSGEELDRLRKVLVEAIDEEKTRSERQKKRHEAMEQARAKRESMLGQIELVKSFNEDDEARDYAAEEGLDPDGIAEHHEQINETTAFDMSNSEFWSSFSSSEEALLECEGLILNLPLTPHSSCTKNASEQSSFNAAKANALTYRVPSNGYYFFVFSSENEVNTNFIRARFQLQKTRYDVARTALRECANSTARCDLPLDIFTTQKVVLELPLRNNDSLWNEQFVIISECEPRTSIYLACVIAVPILILIFAFQ